MNDIDFVFERCQADVKVALQHLVEPAEVRKNLSVQTGPAKHKGVFTKETFKAGQLKLAPWTNIISKKKVSETSSTGIVRAGLFSFAGQDYDICLAPKTTLPSSAEVTGQVQKRVAPPCVTPFWFVRSSSDESTCNMKVEVRKVDVAVSEGGQTAGKRALEVQCLCSTKKIETGHELVVFEQKDDDAQRVKRAKAA